MSAGSDEKKRLEQDLLQRRAGAPLSEVIDARRFQFQPEKIDTIRLRAAQIEAGKTPITERLQKELKKRRKKARRTKALRGEVGRAVKEQKRFEKGERRDKPEEEPRIVGEPKNTGIAYDPDIERRRLDIQERANQDANLRALAEARRDRIAQDRELADRRAARAEARAERAGLPPPVAPAGPVINVAAPPAPVVNVAAPPPANIRVAPVINLPARADADPIPEIERLGAQIRGDVDAFGQELERRNLAVLDDVRRQADEQQRRQREVEDRQLLVDEELRRQRLRYDADLEEVQQRIGMGEVNMGRARDAVIQEIRDAEARLRGAAQELDRPLNYDDVILAADRPQIEEVRDGGGGGELPHDELRALQRQPAPEPAAEEDVAAPQEPLGISGVIQGGGELDLPNVVVERPAQIGPDEPLRLSEEERSEQSVLDEGIPAERLRRGGGRGSGQVETPPTTSEEGEGELFQTPDQPPETPLREQEQVLPAVEPVDVADELRASRLQLPEELPVSRAAERAQERLAAGQPLPGDEERLRLVQEGEEAFNFDPPQSPRSPLPPVRTGEADEALQGLLASPPPRPAAAETPSTPEEEALLREAYGDEPREGQVAQGIAQFGGAARPAPPRVIEDAGIQAVEREPSPPRDVRPLDPEVLFEEAEEAEEVGQVQDQRPQAIRDSYHLFGIALPDLATQTRQGPRTGSRGQKGGLGYRVRNNTDRTLKKVKPGDVVNISGTDQGTDGRGRFRLDTETETGTRVGLDQFEPLVQEGSFIFEKGHRHELGGHFDQNPYGPEPPQPEQAEQQGDPGLLQQAGQAVGGAVVGGLGGAARLAGGAAQGVAEGVYEQLPAAGDVGAALGRGAVRAAGAVGGAAVGAVQGALGGGEEEGEAPAEAEP